MDYTLSKEELDGLLEGEQSSADPPEDAGNQGFTEVVKKRRPDKLKGHAQVKSYAFQKPDKFSKDHLNTMEVAFESFGRSFASQLSNYLRTFVALSVQKIEQITYQDLLQIIPSPTALCIFLMPPLKGSNLVVLDPTLAFLIVDRLLGGRGVPLDYNRELTDIEQSIIQEIFENCLKSLQTSWEPLITIEPQYERLEVNPQYAQIFPPGEIAVKVVMEVTLGEVKGLLHFCIPYVNLEPVLSKFSMQNWYSAMRHKTATSAVTTQAMVGNLKMLKLPVSVELGNVSLSVKEMGALQVGDTIRFYNADYRKPLRLKVGDKEKFYCFLGTVGSRVGVRVLGPILEETKDHP